MPCKRRRASASTVHPKPVPVVPTLLAAVAAQSHADAVGDGERQLLCRRATVRLRDRSIAVTAHDRTAVRHLRQPAAKPV